MKRLYTPLLTLVLLILSGCAVPSASPSETPNSPPVETPSDSQPVQVGTVSGGVYFTAGLLPDAEYSVQAPPERYYAGQVTELIPSPEYGQLLPYIGGYATAMGMPSEIIGICDANGKIVCDPAYNDFEVIAEEGQTLYAFVEFDRLADENYTDLYITTLASPDGGRAETYESVRYKETSAYEFSTTPDEYNYCFSFYWRDAVRYDYITAKIDGKWGVLDWDGSVILPFKYNEPVCFYEGLASVLSDDGKSVSFIDITGETVLGPYDAPPRQYDEWDYSGTELPITNKLMFHEGFARFFVNGKYGMIDKTGRTIIPAEHDYITSFQNGTALIARIVPGSDGHFLYSSGVINSSGKLIVEMSDSWISNTDGKVILYNDAMQPAQMVDYNGNRTPFTQDEQSGVEIIITNPNANEPDRPTKVNIGDIELSLPNSRAEMLPNRNDMFIVFNKDAKTWRLYGLDGEPLTQEQPGVNVHWQYRNDDGYLRITVPEIEYSFSPFFLYDYDGRLVIEGRYRAVVPVLDKFMFRTKNTAGLMDKDGNRIIEVSITRYNED